MAPRPVVVLALSLALSAISLAGSPIAEAGGKPKVGKVERTLGGKIYTADKRFPSAAKSESAFIGKIKKHGRSKFQEDKESKQWKIHFAAFFKKPLTDLEYTVRLYDVTSGKVLVTSFEQYADSSTPTSVLSSVVLERRQFGVNKKVMMVIESQGRTMAAGTFQILGEEERYSGKVDFSDDAGE